MNRIQQQQPTAGTSTTKACDRIGCAMRPVVISHWNKFTGAGFPA